MLVLSFQGLIDIEFLIYTVDKTPHHNHTRLGKILYSEESEYILSASKQARSLNNLVSVEKYKRDDINNLIAVLTYIGRNKRLTNFDLLL